MNHRPCNIGSLAHCPAGAKECQVDILISRDEHICFLNAGTDCIHQKDRAQYTLLIGVKMILARQRVKVIQDFQCIGIHAAACLGIKEIPKHIDRHKIAGAQSAVVIDKPLKRSAGQDVFISIVDTVCIRVTGNDEIKHAALTRRKDAGNVLQHKSSIRMQGNNFLKVVVAKDRFCTGFGVLFCAGSDPVTDITQPAVQPLLDLRPFTLHNLIVSFFHSLSHQLKSHVIRQFDVDARFDKTIADLGTVGLIRDQAVTFMGHDHEVERLVKADVGQRLESGQGVLAVLEVFGELIPNKHNRAKVIFVNNVFQPCCKLFGIHVHGKNTVFSA